MKTSKSLIVLGLLLTIIQLANTTNERDFSLQMCEEISDNQGIIRNPLLRYLQVKKFKISIFPLQNWFFEKINFLTFLAF